MSLKYEPSSDQVFKTGRLQTAGCLNGQMSLEACKVNPTPFTLHPTPYTPHPVLSTLNPTPYTLHPEP